MFFLDLTSANILLGVWQLLYGRGGNYSDFGTIEFSDRISLNDFCNDMCGFIHSLTFHLHMKYLDPVFDGARSYLFPPFPIIDMVWYQANLNYITRGFQCPALSALIFCTSECRKPVECPISQPSINFWMYNFSSLRRAESNFPKGLYHSPLSNNHLTLSMINPLRRRISWLLGCRNHLFGWVIDVKSSISTSWWLYKSSSI